MGRISPGPTRWPPGAERRLVPAKSNLKPQTSNPGRGHRLWRGRRPEVCVLGASAVVRLRPLRDLAERPHCGGPYIEVAVMTGDNESGVARVRGRVLQNGVLGRRPVRLVQ